MEGITEVRKRVKSTRNAGEVGLEWPSEPFLLLSTGKSTDIHCLSITKGTCRVHFAGKGVRWRYGLPQFESRYIIYLFIFSVVNA